MPMDSDTSLIRTLPRQMSLTEAEVVIGASESVTGGSGIVLASNFVMNFLLSASLQHCWSMIESQQIIVLMPLFKIVLPANIGVFFGYIITIASFDLIPIDNYVDEYGGLSPVEPINENFEAIGFESLYVIVNLGSGLILVMLFPICIILEKTLKRIKGKCS